MTSEASRQSLRARYIFKVAGEQGLPDVLRDGVVTVEAGRIVSVGPFTSGQKVRDLGDVAVLPGLVNAHTHLEFSDLAAPLGKPGMSLPAWIRAVIDWRQSNPPSSVAIERGLDESAAAGVTTLGEIGTQGRWTNKLVPPIDVTVFEETIAPTAERETAVLDITEQFASSPAGAWHRGISPHAPYTLTQHAFERLVSLAERYQLPLAMHLAESREELEYLAAATGPFADLFGSLNIRPTRADRGSLTRPLHYLERLANAPRSLVIHGNYLAGDEIDLIARHASRMSVVYCPRTHAYFEHAPHPLPRLLEAGCVVALGTDSRASNPDVALLDEMRLVARQFPQLPPAMVLRLGTLSGAQSFGIASHTGSLEPGKDANLAVVALGDGSASDPFESLFASALPVVATCFRGEWLTNPPRAS
jgi:cytosine/adenosine deaminase-related metal-dependent hydrolase